MTVCIDNVEVSLGRLSDDLRKFAIVGSVRSLGKDHVLSNGELDPGKAESQPQLLKLIAALGAECAGYLNKRYGDNFDEGRVGATAVRAFLEEVRIASRLRRSLDAKMSDLRANLSSLTDDERELLGRLSFASKYDMTPNERDLTALDVALVRLSGRQL